jgi:hypothetical protein
MLISQPFFPREISLPGKPVFFGGNPVQLSLPKGLVIFVGPNGTGKSDTLSSLKTHLNKIPELSSRKIVYLSSGRSSPFEAFRSHVNYPGSRSGDPAAVGNRSWQSQWWEIEGVSGMFLRLKERPDLLLKVQARIGLLHQRSLRLEWGQSGLIVIFSPTTGGAQYFANVEASGLMQRRCLRQ